MFKLRALAAHGMIVWQEVKITGKNNNPMTDGRQESLQCSLTGMYPDVVFVVGGAGEGPTTPLLITDIGPLSRVCTDVDLTNVWRRKRSLASLKWTFEWSLSCNAMINIEQAY